ncbi:hypothetical protein DW352_05755 [Pseudolabrys taiwanensis]|uniref:Uncharacterized protein n=1 Tax=Pseudolabrys taiwanensis TaxID=331696 RepID=A0A345ZT15_9HYPH|nr:hypothetical protein DW352_05755 [Pseudolabrys taiwanensis]
MAGLVPAIHVFNTSHKGSWMPGTRPGMTVLGPEVLISIGSALRRSPNVSLQEVPVQDSAARTRRSALQGGQNAQRLLPLLDSPAISAPERA